MFSRLLPSELLQLHLLGRPPDDHRLDSLVRLHRHQLLVFHVKQHVVFDGLVGPSPEALGQLPQQVLGDLVYHGLELVSVSF